MPTSSHWTSNLPGRNPVYIFNDWHAVMVLSLIGRDDRAEHVITDARRRSVGSNRAVAERVGLGLLEGFASFASGRFDRAVDVLSGVRPAVWAVGGSHAQRDVIDLTLIAAAARSGQADYAGALGSERVQRKPTGARATEQLLVSNGV